jgi:hypothetical protein
VKEKLALIAVLLAIAAAPLLVFWYRGQLAAERYPADARVFQITAVAGIGAYTVEEVNGANFWWKRYAPMTLALNLGDHVVLDIRSADVCHQFYVPGLGLGPVEVRPEKGAVIEFTATQTGIFQYFCTTMCGQCHVYMTGWIVISSDAAEIESPDPIVCPLCFVDFGKPPEGNMVELGDWQYQANTCNACHGWDGIGGVRNFNYAKDTIPAHERTAEKLFIRSEEDADSFIQAMIEHGSLEDLEDEVDIPMFNVVKARFEAIRNIIRNGSDPEKKDPNGPTPPLWMPAWQHKLTEHEINAIILYFIDLFPWEEEEG